VSVAQLARLAAVLDLPVDELLTTTSPAGATDPPEPALPPREDDPRDDHVVEALPLSFGQFALDELAAVLGWPHARTQTAVTALQQRWTDGALRISGTADYLEVGLRPGVLASSTQARVTARRHARTPLTPTGAGHLLQLIRAELLRPVNPHIPPNIMIAVYAADALVERGLAVRAPNPAGLLVSRGLLFALGIIPHPHAGRSTDAAGRQDPALRCTPPLAARPLSCANTRWATPGVPPT
jgi:hypothetical protein